MKFGKLTNGLYKKRYEEDQIWFYNSMVSQLKKLQPKSVLLDIGSGPGTIARFASERKLSLKILGVEPSNLVNDGINLSIRLVEEKNQVKYTPKKGGITETRNLFNLKNESIDCIILMRSAHEIVKTIGYINFKIELKKLIKLLKRNGLIMIGDPNYRIDIMKNKSETYKEEVELAREINEELIYHSHPVTELIPAERIINLLAEFGCDDVIYYDSRPNLSLLAKLRKIKPSIKRSPLDMYVLVVKKS
jgi:SAM-dependent methyltransferase